MQFAAASDILWAPCSTTRSFARKVSHIKFWLKVLDDKLVMFLLLMLMPLIGKRKLSK